MNNTAKTPQSAENQTTIARVRRRKLKRLEVGFQLLAVALGFVHIWADHHDFTNADAMSYLDIAEAYLRGDWQTAVNAYWSPLYSWCIGVALFVVRPSSYWKFAVVHLVNFALYLFALGCFWFLIRELVRRQHSLREKLLAAELVTLPDWALLALGYSLFIWSSLFLLNVGVESPDVLVAAFVYLATGIVLRIRRKPSSWPSFVLLGIVLGFGYLAKSVMFPMALVFLFISLFSNGSWRRTLPRVLVAAALFLLVASPFVFAISKAKGRLTFGDSGRLNYLWAINKVAAPHWQGQEPGSGTPLHPTRKILDSPPTFEFGEPIGGTYPVWYDPTYWYEGSVSHFDLRQQVWVFADVAKSYYELFHNWGLQYGLLVGLLSLYLVNRRWSSLVSGLTLQWSVIVPAIAGMGLYATIHVQGRYVASFIVLLWLSLFSAVRLSYSSDLSHSSDSVRFIRSITIALVAIIIFTAASSSSREAILTARNIVGGEDESAHEQWQVADGLRQMGIVPGDKVAVIGNSFRSFWAHLMGLRIVAEVRRQSTDSFWEADATRREQVINAFAQTSAKAIVAEKPILGTDLTGWQKIGKTDYYIYFLKR
jgi:Dolichyl-phosphate-mannose-protein mannosyltransferase